MPGDIIPHADAPGLRLRSGPGGARGPRRAGAGDDYDPCTPRVPEPECNYDRQNDLFAAARSTYIEGTGVS
jgi:hypothetical protein